MARVQGERPDEPLTLDQIVGAAIDLLDQRGPKGFSIRALAGELGVYPTAIYWHARDRTTLLGHVGARLMRDAIPSPEGKHWAQWLREVGYGYRAAALAHPQVTRAISSELVNDPSTFGLPEVIVSQLLVSGLPRRELVHAYNAMVGATVGFIDLELAQEPWETEEDRAAARRAVVDMDAGAYPALSSVIDDFADHAFSLRWTSGAERPLDDSFAYLVELIASGLEARAAR
jgi:AcrR family transcriptional regulator